MKLFSTKNSLYPTADIRQVMQLLFQKYSLSCPSGRQNSVAPSFPYNDEDECKELLNWERIAQMVQILCSFQYKFGDDIWAVNWHTANNIIKHLPQ